MPTLREHILLLDRPHVWAYPATTYDVVDPGDNFPTPAWWRSVVYVDRGAGVVRLRMKAARVIFTVDDGLPGSTENTYTLETGTEGVVQVYDLASSALPAERVGQNIEVTPTLPSTNGRDYSWELVSKSGDPRVLTLVNTGFAAPMGVDNIPIEFRESGTPVAPLDGATYTLDLYFWHTS